MYYCFETVGRFQNISMLLNAFGFSTSLPLLMAAYTRLLLIFLWENLVHEMRNVASNNDLRELSSAVWRLIRCVGLYVSDSGLNITRLYPTMYNWRVAQLYPNLFRPKCGIHFSTDKPWEPCIKKTWSCIFHCSCIGDKSLFALCSSSQDLTVWILADNFCMKQTNPTG